MEKSETLSELAFALSKLQAKAHDVFKSKTGYGYKYSDLASVLDVTRPLCAEFGLAVTQLCESDVANTTMIGVETMLVHQSGEYISSKLYMPITPAKGMSPAQCAGSVITYARRYALAAILGIAQTDNDAAVTEPDNLKSNVAKTSTVEYPHKELFELLQKVKVAPTEQQRWLAHYKVTSLTQLSIEQAAQLSDGLNKKLAAQKQGVKENGVQV